MAESEDLTFRWYLVRKQVKEKFGQRPDINAMLFLIGMNEVGLMKDEWTKEEKQDLMHIAMCKLMSTDGYYRLTKIDEEGWHHYETVKTVPVLEHKEQEEYLKKKIVEYFEAL